MPFLLCWFARSTGSLLLTARRARLESPRVIFSLCAYSPQAWRPCLSCVSAFRAIYGSSLPSLLNRSDLSVQFWESLPPRPALFLSHAQWAFSSIHVVSTAPALHSTRRLACQACPHRCLC